MQQTPPKNPPADKSFIIEYFDSCEQAETVWRNFEKEADFTVFQSYDWLSRWYELLGMEQEYRPCIVLVSTRDRYPVILMPLTIHFKSGNIFLEWLGGGLTDFQGPLLSPEYSTIIPEDAFNELWRSILKKMPLSFDVIHFEKQPERIGGQDNPFVKLHGSVGNSINYYTELSEDWQLFYQQQSSGKARRDLRRRERLLNQQGREKLVVAQDCDQVELMTKKLMHLKGERYQLMEKNIQFYSEIGIDMFRLGRLHLSSLQIDNEPIAIVWALIFKEKFYYLMPAFSPEWKKYAPGRILIRHLMQWCCEQGIHTFDFSFGQAEYKKKLANKTMYLFDYTQPHTLSGRLYCWQEGVIKKIRRNPILDRLFCIIKNSG